MDFDRNDTAVVFIDPQNEVLSEKGLGWGAVGNSVKENQTIENMERIFKAAKDERFRGFYLSPLFLPHGLWLEIQRTLETEEIETKMFARRGAVEPRRLRRVGR